MECAGWRTLLDYRENHVRDDEGVLIAVLPRWTAEAERDAPSGHPEEALYASATASSREEAWRQVRRATAQAVQRAMRPYDGARDFA
ncbi:MAG: hypothetical protein JWL72_4212 [Ilumatobacteraceae bacterium]|nr:hypothetical protein [Ilumatobacteraceae bacterium]MCU1390874.1 hypothetical protein [Ilumatobacteraceae bacterium]